MFIYTAVYLIGVQFVPHGKHFVSTTNSNMLLLSKEIIGIVCQIGELVNVTAHSTTTTVLETVKCMYLGQGGA
jgi:hypothetical protein